MINELILNEIFKQNKHWSNETPKNQTETYKRQLFYVLEKYLKEPQIISIVGLRRTGKTTILKQIISSLITEKGVNPLQIMFLSFDEALVTEKLPFTEYIDTFLEKTDEKKIRYIFLDEIQYIKKWQHLLKRYYDTRPNIKFFISGSSSLFIQKKSTESLAGRIYEFKLKHLSFEEYLEIARVEDELLREYKKFAIADFNKIEYSENEYKWFLANYSKKLETFFENYLLYYQFPETIKKEDKETIHKYIEDAIYKKSIEYDIPRLFDINKVDELKFSFRILINETSNEIEFGKIAGEAGIELNTFKKYLNYFHNSLLFDIVYNYTRSVRKSKRLQKKGYIASSNFFSTFHPDFFKIKSISDQYMGRLVETYIYNILKEKFEYISFYKKGKKEIDFVCNNEIFSKQETSLIEVKYVNNIGRENFDFITKTAREIFKAEKYFIFSKKDFNNNEKRLIIPCFLIK